MCSLLQPGSIHQKSRVLFLLPLFLLAAFLVLPSPALAEEPASFSQPQSALADDSPSPAFPQLQVLSLGGDDPLPLTLEAQVGKKPLHATPQGTQLVAWGRFAGKTALGTMQQVSSAGWSKSDTVVVATVSGYWDAVCANALAGVAKAPVLMTKSSTLSAETLREIQRLGASKAYLCGGRAAISSGVESQLKSHLEGDAEVVRLAGRKAVDTSAAIAREVGQDASDTCIIATDMGYWDALAASPYSYAKHAPIFLARAGKSLTADALAAIRELGFTRAVIAGGTGAVSENVTTQLKGLGLSTTRVAGASAYATAVKFAEWSIGQGMTPVRMGVATGKGYWDALAGAALCGKNNAVLVLADDSNHFEACAFATRQRHVMNRALVFGGRGAVGSTVFSDLQASTLQTPVSTYVVRFDANGGSGSMPAQTVIAGKFTKLSANAFARTYYDFAGWNTARNGSGQALYNGQGVSSLAKAGDSVTLYAQWTPSLAYYRSKLNLTTMYRSVLDHGPKPAPYQKYIVLHDTEGEGDPANVVNWWVSAGQGVAAHFVVGRDGRIVQCVQMDRIAHHAGFGNTGHNAAFGVTDESRDDKRGTVSIGAWAADYGMNSYSIGIEMVHVGGGAPYTRAQLNAVDNLIAYIDAYYGFQSAIIDHKAWRSGNSDTSPEYAGYLANYQRYRHY